MQIETTGRCIISGNDSAKKISLKKESLDKVPKEAPSVEKPAKKSKIAFSLGGLIKDAAAAAKAHRRPILAAAAGGLVCAAGISALGTYCTIGVDYYCGGKLLCTVAAADDAAAIIGDAAEKADLLGVEEPQIEASAKIALKKDIVDGDEAVDKILSVSPYLCRGYVVSVNGIDLFVADSRETIDKTLDKYVKKYKINDTARLSGNIEIREKIMRTDEITPTDYITTLLEEGNVLTVMNTVDLTQRETIPHETEQVADEAMYMGESVVETKGRDGALVTVCESIYSNGELLSTAIISSETAAEPVTEVVRVGTKPRNALNDGFSYPVRGRLSSEFGQRWGRQHRGIDLAVDIGTPVAAAFSGTVITAEYKESYGNLVQIDHGYGIVTSYAHLNSIAVSAGQIVAEGDIVAYSGNTGNSTGPHLHFEVINNGEYLNPLDYLR